MCRWKSTPEERKMPKAPEPEEGGFAVFSGWLEEKFDNGNSGQSESLALTKPLEQLTVKPRLTGETARLGSVSALQLAQNSAGSVPPLVIGERKGASEDIWPVRMSPPSPRWEEGESKGRASIKRLLIGLKLWRGSWGKGGREGGRKP